MAVVELFFLIIGMYSDIIILVRTKILFRFVGMRYFSEIPQTIWFTKR